MACFGSKNTMLSRILAPNGTLLGQKNYRNQMQSMLISGRMSSDFQLVNTQSQSIMDQSPKRSFGKFRFDSQSRSNRGFHDEDNSFSSSRSSTSANIVKTYTYEDIQSEGHGLQNGIKDLPVPMQKRLQREGVSELFPVQLASYHLFASEKSELIVKSRTGTGKTLSFLLPLEYLIKYADDDSSQQNTDDNVPSWKRRRDDFNIKAIILEPTRELAMQVQDQVRKFCSLRSSLLYGGGSSKNIQCK